MRLKLTVDLPRSADPDAALLALLQNRVEGQGLTITTARGYAMDAELLDVERCDVRQEVNA